MSQETIEALEAEVEREKARNDKLLHLLSMMESLWPEDEKKAVQSLASQVEATKSVLRDCSQQLAKRSISSTLLSKISLLKPHEL
jgi:hypothetical protein